MREPTSTPAAATDVEAFGASAPPPTRKRTQGGRASTDLVLSASVDGNAEVFPEILALHVPDGSRIADVTWGKGVFWRNVPEGTYEVHGTDLSTGVDCRALPYEDASFDCVVLDPPYMAGLFRPNVSQLAGSGTHVAFRSAYSNEQAAKPGGPKGHAAVLDLYYRAGREAHRVLRERGVFIVKCQDEVDANRQHLTHVELINEYARQGFFCKDLFVVVRRNRPGVSRIKRQVHARKNHSYFLVLTKERPDPALRAAA